MARKKNTAQNLEETILHESKNFYINNKMEILLTGITASVVVGKAKNLQHGIGVINKMETYVNNVRKMYNHY